MPRERLDSLDFIPCRNDKCKIEAAHAAHPEDDKKNTKRMTTCPRCQAPIITLPRKRGRCSQCVWRGSIDLRKASLNA